MEWPKSRYNQVKKEREKVMKTLDIHTHHPAPQPEAILALMIKKGEDKFKLHKNQQYSIGIHPWDTEDETEEREWDLLEELARRPEIVAIGETGLDLTPKGGPLFRQLQVFKRHVDLSEALGKPLIVHNVKSHDIIAGARRDMKPTQPWAIHGFRKKPEVAEMLLRAGCWLSFGEEFNPEALLFTPEDRILAETDNSNLSIEEIIARLSATRGKDLTEIIAANTERFLSYGRLIEEPVGEACEVE